MQLYQQLVDLTPLYTRTYKWYFAYVLSVWNCLCTMCLLNGYVTNKMFIGDAWLQMEAFLFISQTHALHKCGNMKKYEGVSVSEDCCVFPWCPTWTWLLCRSIVAAFFRAYCIAYMLNLFPRKKKTTRRKLVTSEIWQFLYILIFGVQMDHLILRTYLHPEHGPSPCNIGSQKFERYTGY